MRYKNVIWSILVGSLLFLVWTMYLLLNFPSVGVKLSMDSNQFEVTLVETPGAGDQLGIQVGDVVVAVNNTDPGEHWTVRRYGGVEQAETISIWRDGSLLEFSVKDVSTLDYWDIVTFMLQAFSLFVAYVIYKKIKDSDASRLLSAVFFLIFIIFMGMLGSVRGDPLGKLVMTSGMLLAPIVVYQFLAAFLKEKGGVSISLRGIKPAYMTAAVLTGLMTVFFVDTPFTYPLYRATTVLPLFFIVAGFCFNFAMLIYVYRKHRKHNLHLAMIIKTVFGALFCALAPVTFLSFVPRIVFGVYWADTLITSSFIFILPLSFVYLLVTRRLYDIDMIIRRILLAMTIALIPSLVFTGITKLLLPEQATAEELALFFMIQLAVCSVLFYSLENLTTRLEPVLYPRRHRLQLALKKIARNLGTISTFQEMKDIILVDIVETLETCGGAIVFRYKDKLETILEGDIEKEQVEELVLSGDLDKFGYTSFEISRQEEYTSYLVITGKRKGTLLGLEEIQWLNLINTYLAVALENVQLIRRLDARIQKLSTLLPNEDEADNVIWFRKLMFELQEKERVRIAMDIHDTTMQDLFFLKSRVRKVMDMNNFAKEDREFINGLLDYIDVINANLRQSCFELHPYLLREVGLVSTLYKLFNAERAVCEFRIQFSTSETSEIEEQDMELKRHLFRMVQELLNNAKKYSHASTVWFSIHIRKSVLYFDYRDDGIGFDPNRPIVREIGSSGMGMQQLKSRVLSLGGLFQLESGTGKGVHFQAEFPVKGERNRRDEAKAPRH